VTATDAAGQSAADAFDLTVINTNDAPAAAAPLPDVTVGEDAAPKVIDISGLFADVDAGDTLVVSVAGNSDSRLVSAAISADGKWLTLGLAPNLSGVATITLRGTDAAGAAAEDSFTLTVLPDAAPVEIEAGDLVFRGTGAADHVRFVRNGSGIDVLLNGVRHANGPFAFTGRIVAYGGGGDDDLGVAGDVTRQAWLHGQAGNDKLNGGGGSNVILGGDGADYLLGGSARDLVIGGRGADRLVGNPGDDILVAGAVRHGRVENDDAALAAILTEWTSGRDFVTRVANLRGAGTGDRANGAYFLLTSGPAATVFDDAAADEVDLLTGTSGEDWFLHNAGDKVTTMSDTEEAAAAA